MDFESLALSNDFIFAKVMQDKKLCIKLLETILNIKIRDIAYHEEQKVMEDAPDGKAVRLDVYLEDESNTVYDIEMQTTDTKELPRRSRYYQGRIDVANLDKGTDVTYRDLAKSFVIFICLKDVIGKGRHYYTFENRCNEDPSIALCDGAIKVFVSPDSEMNDITPELSNFLNYLLDGVVRDDFTRALDESVQYARKNKEWKEEYRMLNMQRRIWEQDARAEGIAETEKHVFAFVQKSIVSPNEAAEELGITVQELEKKMIDAGFKIPSAV